MCDRLIIELIEDADLNDALKWLEFSAQNGLEDLASRKRFIFVDSICEKRKKIKFFKSVIRCVDGVVADYAHDLMQSRQATQLSRFV